MNARAPAEQERRVLIVQRSSALDGSAHSALLLADGLREAGWDTHVAFGFDGPIVERYDASGHCTHIVPHDNWLRRYATPQFFKDTVLEVRKARSFVSLIDRIQPDIVYLNTTVSLAGAVAAWVRGISVIWHLREMFADEGGELYAPEWAVPLIRRVILWGADCVVANSFSTVSNMLGEKVERWATVVPNAISATFFNEERTQREARARLNLPSKAVIVGVPGTLRPVKGHLFFLHAIAPILFDRPTWYVAVTGGTDSAYARQIMNYANSLGLEGQVSFMGWVRDMTAYYRACDVICVPSQNETFGRTVIEAFASGTPVVATGVGGMKEVIDSGETGLLVPYNNDDALVSSIVRLLENPQLRQEISTKARQVAEAEYHEAVYKRRIVQVVNEIAGITPLTQ